MNIANINVLTLKIIRDTIQTRLTNLLKRLDLELEQRLQIEGGKKDQKTCWEEISSLIRRYFALPLMRLVINWNIDYNQYNLSDSAAPNLLTYKPALSFVFATKTCLSAMAEFYKGGGENESKMGFELVLVIKWSHDPISALLFP